jgi:hypothetical protein
LEEGVNMTPKEIREWDKTFDSKNVTAEVVRARARVETRARVEIAAQLAEMNITLINIFREMRNYNEDNL